MAGESGGNTLVKLKIIGYEKPDYSGNATEYQVQFNPVKLDESFTIEYADETVPGSTDEVKKFKNAPSRDLKLNLTLDGTGVAVALNGQNQSAGNINVLDEIKKFKAATSDYIGETHDIPYVKVLWGDFEFKGRLKSLSISHTMFKANGQPLRSTIDATFSSATQPEKQALEGSRSSPDLTHVRVVQVGDTLPLMCQRIYNDSTYYIKVAKFNNLVDFRNLEPGSEIIFPPVV